MQNGTISCEEKVFNLLDKSLGKVGDLSWNNMGDKFYLLAGSDKGSRPTG